MRYFVRDAGGRELVVPTLRDLHDLYAHGFLGDDDLVRPESAARWVRAGAMPALRGVREKRADPRRMLLFLAAAVALGAAIAFLLGVGR
ncbi:MAG TPA: hypothetical protein VIW03_16130 [Anaeromyxobacter sp.]